MSVAALTIAMMSYGQTSNDSITFHKDEIEAIIITIEDILEWQQQDMESGDTNMGSYEEGWGSNYWLTEMVDELMARYTGKNNYVQPHNR